jgi:hypothetical protein
MNWPRGQSTYLPHPFVPPVFRSRGLPLDALERHLDATAAEERPKARRGACRGGPGIDATW